MVKKKIIKSKNNKKPTEIIEKILRNVKFKNGYPDVLSLLRNSMPIFDLLRPNPYNDIVDYNCVLHTMLDILEEYKTSKKNNINQNERQTIAKKIHNELSSFPIRYQFFLPVPKVTIENEQKIIKNISLISFDDKTTELYMKGSGKKDIVLGEVGVAQPKIKEGDTFLKIVTVGFVNSKDGDFSVYGYDPMYVLKIFISLQLVLDNLSLDKGIVNTNISSTFKEIYVYKDKNTFVRVLDSHENEFQLIGKLAFLNIEDENLKDANNSFAKLFKEEKTESKAKLQRQIKNSLFWFFEALKTENQNLRTVFYTSAFDSFFGNDKNKEEKAEIIALHISETVQEDDFIREHLIGLYNSRNEIIHGQRQIFTHLVENRSVREKDQFRNEEAMFPFFISFAKAKLIKFIKSSS